MRLNIGIYNLHMRAMGGGEKLTLALAEHLSQTNNLYVFTGEPLDVGSLERFFDVDLSRVHIVPLKRIAPLSRVAAKVRRQNSRAVSLHHFRQLKNFNLDLFVNNSYASDLHCPAARGIYMCMFPHMIQDADAVNSYSQIVAISKYSADWVEKLWNRRAEIIYPPCDDMGPPEPKAKMILHVGRFIADGEDERHYKGQRLKLHAFDALTDLQQSGWELHFAGSIAPDNGSRHFANAILEAATASPVFFHFNASREELRSLYRQAAIYWHATGYGSDAGRYPAKQEHFGISTVEAMSAGAVPVVYAAGGQKEIVTDGMDGLWWTDLEGLITHTRRLASDSALRCALAQHATISSQRFGKSVFAAQVDQLIAKSAQ